MNVSPNFSPSIKLMKPYFLISGLLYMFSMVFMFFLNFDMNIYDFELVGWVHIYMLGFVMMAIFASMAQLGPIVVETKHHNVDIFRNVWVFLVFGLFLMSIGFYIDVILLIFPDFVTFLA